MKQTLLLFCSLFLFSLQSAKAQTYPYLSWGPYENNRWMSQNAIDFGKNKVYRSVCTVFEYSNSGRVRQQNTSISEYNHAGQEVSRTEFTGEQAASEKTIYAYTDSLLTKKQLYRRDRLVRTEEIRYNANRRVVEYVAKNSKGDICFRRQNEFDSTNKHVTKTEIYKREKLIRSIEYTYHEDYSLAMAREYKRGKLKSTWNYACEPSGSKEKKGQQIQVCKNVSVDSAGNKVETSRIVKSNGDIQLEICTLNAQNRIIRKQVFDDIHHSLVLECTVREMDHQEETVYKFYDKGKLITFSKTLVSDSDKILQMESGNDKKRLFKMVCTYNEKDLPLSTIHYNSDGHKTLEMKYDYVSF